MKVAKKKKEDWALCCTYAGRPFFPSFDSQVPHLSFYEHLTIL